MVVVALAVTAGHATAQIGSLPEEVARTTSLDGTARSQIREFVASVDAKFASESFADAQRGMRDVEDTLRIEGLSVSVRQELARGLVDRAETLIDSGTDAEPADRWKAMLGLRLAGVLATEQTARPVLRAMDADDAWLRRFAIYAAELMLLATADQANALDDRTILLIIRTLGDAIDQAAGSTEENANSFETDPITRGVVIGGAAKALRVGLSIRPDDVAGALPLAERELAESLGAALLARPEDMDNDLVTDAVIASADPLQRSVALTRTQRPDDTLRAIARFGGDLAAALLRHVETHELTEAAADSPEVGIARQAERLLNVASTQLPGGAFTAPPPRFADPLVGGSVGQLRSSVTLYLGGGGELESAPYNITALRYAAVIAQDG